EVEGAVGVDDNFGIAEIAFAIAWCGGIERIGFLFYEMDAVVADGVAQLFVDFSGAIDKPGRIEGVKFSGVIGYRAGADGFLPCFVDAEDDGILFPGPEIGGVVERPLVTTETAEGFVVGGIQQPVEIIFPVVVKGDAVAYEEVAFWFEIVDVARGLDPGVVMDAKLGVVRCGGDGDGEQE